jgi:ribonucleoside-triphosphate reductase
MTNNILSDITVWAKYSRFLPTEGRRETWEEICDRVLNMHLSHVNSEQISESLKSIFKDFIVTKKLLPAMRTAQFGGRPIELNNARGFNCSALPVDHHKAFSETMFLLLSGCGVGFSVQSHHVRKLPKVRMATSSRKWLIGDDIIGWADAIKVLCKSYFLGTPKPVFDFREIREKGEPLITSGGKAPGPEPLKHCLFEMSLILDNAMGRKLKPIEAHDLMCVIADAVLSGGIRRSSLISLFDHDDDAMLHAKSGNWWEAHPYRARANNSVMLDRSKITEAQFKKLWKVVENSGSGEPGFYFSNSLNLLTNPC